MQPIREDEDDVLARLEARLETVVSVLSRMKDRNAELEARLSEALSAREALEASHVAMVGTTGLGVVFISRQPDEKREAL